MAFTSETNRREPSVSPQVRPPGTIYGRSGSLEAVPAHAETCSGCAEPQIDVLTGASLRRNAVWLRLSRSRARSVYGRGAMGLRGNCGVDFMSLGSLDSERRRSS